MAVFVHLPFTHASVVHAFLSSQLAAAPAHFPSVQVSLSVQALSSLHAVPLALAGLEVFGGHSYQADGGEVCAGPVVEEGFGGFV